MTQSYHDPIQIEISINQLAMDSLTYIRKRYINDNTALQRGGALHIHVQISFSPPDCPKLLKPIEDCR